MKTLNTFKKSCLIISALFLAFQPTAFSMNQYGTESLTEQEKEEVELALSVVNILSEYKKGIVGVTAYAALVASVFTAYSINKASLRSDSLLKLLKTNAEKPLTSSKISSLAKASSKAINQAAWRLVGTAFLGVVSFVSYVFIPTDVEAATMGEHYLRGLLDMGKTSEFEKLSEDEQRFYIAGSPVLRETLIYIGENIENLENNINEELFRAEEQG